MILVYIYIYIYIHATYEMKIKLVGWLVGSYGMSILIGYLMPNPIYTYTLNIGFVNE